MWSEGLLSVLVVETKLRKALPQLLVAHLLREHVSVHSCMTFNSRIRSGNHSTPKWMSPLPSQLQLNRANICNAIFVIRIPHFLSAWGKLGTRTASPAPISLDIQGSFHRASSFPKCPSPLGMGLSRDAHGIMGKRTLRECKIHKIPQTWNFQEIPSEATTDLEDDRAAEFRLLAQSPDLCTSFYVIIRFNEVHICLSGFRATADFP